jgi:hypothetical protein
MEWTLLIQLQINGPLINFVEVPKIETARSCLNVVNKTQNRRQNIENMTIDWIETKNHG